MTALLDVLTAGYVGDRVAGTVTLVRDGALVAVIDPGMVADRDRILGPLTDLQVAPGDVTDVVFSHHHPDHTVNAALFPNARIHDFQATYVDDQWIDREFEDDVALLSLSVRLMLTPGHTPQDVTTLVDTDRGLVACTHLWWSAGGPLEDPYAEDAATLRASRQRVLDLKPTLIVPGHGAPFVPLPSTPL
ncbi:MBL fold metallo-hydrolase [Angustibacter luteus]|uniref:Metallo-beta-lactamase domain-containing protein 1 n=1 Tax=Angustibacter luteus TaxID=658456 RepID=A0ABW1JAU5_9ACTN